MQEMNINQSSKLIEPLESRRLLSASLGGFVTQTNLVSDGFVPAAHTDPGLKNPWGIAFAPGMEFWVSDNNSGLATLYDGNGVSQFPTVNIPGAAGAPGTPTGQVFNSTSGFVVTQGASSGPGVFILVNEDGVISGWNPSVNFNNAVVALDHSASGAVYKGATLASVGGAEELFVTNFNSGSVEAYDSSFQRVTLAPKAFRDRSIPKDFAPFNIQQVGGNLYVTYARQNSAKHDDVGGAGNGFVDVFNTSGKLLHHLQHGSFMDSPWGVTVAPSSWGKFAGDILVGQFKSGQIDLFNPKSGRFVSTLNDQSGKPIQNDRLWALTPGTGSDTASTQSLYFTAGLNDEQDGLFGTLTFTAVAEPKKQPPSSGGTGTFGY